MNAMNKDDILVYLKKFKERNSHKYHIVKLGLFGSFSRGDGNEKSDIDIAVVLEKPKMFDLVGIKQDIEEALSCYVDIVRVRDNMNKLLKKRIEKEVIFV